MYTLSAVDFTNKKTTFYFSYNLLSSVRICSDDSRVCVHTKRGNGPSKYELSEGTLEDVNSLLFFFTDSYSEKQKRHIT